MKTGWVETKLADAITLNYGKGLAKDQRSPEGSVPVYGANGVMDWSNQQLTEGPSLVIGRKGSAGEITRVDGPFWPSDVTYFTSHDQSLLNFDFMHYALSMLNLPSMARGVKPGINRNDVYGLTIPLPPLEEQQRIVAVLDEAFEGLARARAHAEANLQNARELFENSLSAFIDRHKEDWSATTLGEAYDVRDGTHDSPKYHTTGRALITSKNLGRDGLHFEKVKFISEEDFESISKRSGVHKGDVLFAMIGTIGNPIVVEVEPDFAIKNVALFKMKEGRSGQFLRYMLRSKHVVDKMKAEAKGTTQQFVGLGYLRAFPIILPEQKMEMALVDDLDRMETQCRSAEDLYEKKLQDLDDLRQSLLQKAFAGELT